MPTGIEDMLVRLRELAPNPLIAAASQCSHLRAERTLEEMHECLQLWQSRWTRSERRPTDQARKGPFQQECADGARSKFGTEHPRRREVGPRPRAVVQSIRSLVRVRGSALQSSDLIFGHFGHPRQTDQTGATMLKHSDVTSNGGSPETIKHMFDHREH
jgi:hypothetical protein